MGWESLALWLVVLSLLSELAVVPNLVPFPME